MQDSSTVKPETFEDSTQSKEKGKGKINFFKRLLESKEDGFKRELPHMQRKPQEIIGRFLGIHYDPKNAPEIKEEISTISKWVEANANSLGGLSDQYHEHKKTYEASLYALQEVLIYRQRDEMPLNKDDLKQIYIQNSINIAKEFEGEARAFLENLDKILKASGLIDL